jgi:hypothetical protein
MTDTTENTTTQDIQSTPTEHSEAQDTPSKSGKKRTFSPSKVQLGALAVLAIVGLSLTITSVTRQTTLQNHASGITPTLSIQQQPVVPSLELKNINSTDESLETHNTDGSMGSTSASSNWSNSLPAALKGNLSFAVTNTGQGTPNYQGGMPSGKPTYMAPSQGQSYGNKPSGAQGDGKNQGHKHGPQTVSALYLTISKVEVHIAYLGTPGKDKTKEAKEYTTPAEGYTPPCEGYTTPSTGYTTPTKGYTTPSTGYTTPTKGYTTPSTGYTTPTKGYTTPSTGYTTPTTGYTTSAAAGNQPGPIDHWETLNIPTPVQVDLVQLAKTNDLKALGLTALAAGKYTQVRLYVKSATATFGNSETPIPLTILGKDYIVKIVQPFTINACQTTKLTLDFDAQHTVIAAKDKYILKPVVAHLLETH